MLRFKFQKPSGLDGALGVTARKPVVMVHVSVQENASLRINAQFLLLFHVLGKISKTRPVPTGAAQVINLVLFPLFPQFFPLVSCLLIGHP